MRHDTRKIIDENPLITRGLYGGGGGGGGGGDGGGQAGSGGVAGGGPSPAAPGSATGGSGGPSGIGPGDAIGNIGLGMDPNAAINAANMASLGITPGQTISAMGMMMGVPTMGLSAATAGMIGLGNMTGNVHGPTAGEVGASPGGGLSNAGGGMARFDMFGNYIPFSEGTTAVPGGGGGGGGINPAWLQPDSQQEAQDWAQNGFNPQAYLAANPDVAASGMDPWVHYYTYGAKEGRSAGGAPAGGGGAGGAPAPTDPQAQLRQAQIDLVNQQRDIATQMLQRQNLLQDQLLSQQGLTAVRDAQGNITGYQATPERTARDQQEQQIAQQLRQRTLDALAGNLPVDPALERGLTEQRGTLEATLRGNLGTGYATSTPGIQALADFDKRAEELRAAQRRDQLTTAEGLRLAGTQVGQTASSGNLASILGITNAGGIPAGILNNAGSGLNSSLSNLLGLSSLDNAYRIAQLQGSGANDRLQQQMRFQDNAGTGQLVGQLGSAFLRSDLATDIWDSVMDLF